MPFPKKEKKEASAEQSVIATPDYIVFETLDTNPESHKISSTDTVLDPETGRIRKIRYSPGASTIYMDEMEPYELELPAGNLMFMNRKLEISSSDETALEFLRMTDQNKDKTRRMDGKKPASFREIKPLEDIDKKLKTFALTNKAESLAAECSEEEMLPFAHVLGISTTKDPREIRVEFIEKSRYNPAFFLKYFDNPKNIRQYHVSVALRKNILLHDKNAVKWADTGKHIVEIPLGKACDDFLADFSTTEEGKAFYEALKKVL